MDENYSQRELIAEIKLLLRSELADLRDGIHGLEVRLTELKGDTISRSVFEAALSEERAKREEVEHELAKLDKELTSLRGSIKIYTGLIAATVSIAFSGIIKYLIALLG